MAPARLAAAIALIVLAAGASRAGAATLEPVGDFDQPVFVASDPDHPERLFVAERRGTIELVEAGDVVGTFADFSAQVSCPPAGCTGERGLMSIALAPDFATSGHLYVDYAQDDSGELRIEELTANGNAAPASSLRPLLTIPHPGESNHNGGQLQIGPEGDLYISTGDGGGGNDTHHNSQSPTSLLGKILRIDPAEADPEPTIWSLGLRNPFRFSFDRLNGDTVIGDVGQDAREEIDLAPATPSGGVGGQGANYGWNCREGLIAGPATDLPEGVCAASTFSEPVFDYPRSGEGAHGCAIIGGYVVRDESVPDIYGRYLYVDLCSGGIRSLLLPATAAGRATDDRSEDLDVSNPVSFGEDSCGRVYVVEGGGPVSRFVGAEPADCTAPPQEEPPPEEEPPPGKTPPTPIPPVTLPLITPPLPRSAPQVGIGARPTKVVRGAATSIVVRVTPCATGDARIVELRRGGAAGPTEALGEDCTARFRPRIRHRSTFRALVSEDAANLAARSPRLTIAVGVP